MGAVNAKVGVVNRSGRMSWAGAGFGPMRHPRNALGSNPVWFEQSGLTLFLMLAASPALALSDATEIPPPPYLMQPVMVLVIFLGIFVCAAWSLSALMGISPRPPRMKWRRRARL